MYKVIKDFYVGQEVYIGRTITYGWNRAYKYLIYEPHTIKSISPKRKSLTLNNGAKIKIYDSGRTDITLYEYDPEMDNDTKKAREFFRFLKVQSIYNDLYRNYSIVETVAHLPAEKVTEAINYLSGLINIKKE